MKKFLISAIISIAFLAPAHASNWFNEMSTMMACYPANGAPYLVKLGADSIAIWQPGTRIVRHYLAVSKPIPGLGLEYLASNPGQDRILLVHIEKNFNYVRALGRNSDGSPGGIDSCKMCGGHLGGRFTLP